MTTLFSLGGGAGFYGTKPNIAVSKGDGLYPYTFEFATPGWDFETFFVYEAAALVARSEFANSEEFKQIPAPELDAFQIENTAYWVSGGNTRWMFHNDDYFMADWDNDDDRENVCNAFTELYETELKECKTMYDIIQVFKNDEGYLIEKLMESYPEMWEYDDDDFE